MKVAIIVSAHIPTDESDDFLAGAVRSVMTLGFYDVPNDRAVLCTIDAVQIVRLKEAETLLVVGKAIA